MQDLWVKDNSNIITVRIDIETTNLISDGYNCIYLFLKYM